MVQKISLPDAIAKKAKILAQNLEISLDELSVIALQELLDKHSRSSNADLDFERKIKIARRGMNKYQNALIELAK
jgi:hypothetical protein